HLVCPKVLVKQSLFKNKHTMRLVQNYDKRDQETHDENHGPHEDKEAGRGFPGTEGADVCHGYEKKKRETGAKVTLQLSGTRLTSVGPPQTTHVRDSFRKWMRE